MAEDIARSVMEPERDVGREISDPMRHVVVDRVQVRNGSLGATRRRENVDGSLRVDGRASRKVPQSSKLAPSPDMRLRR
jgi:hypothetical protein